MNAAPWILLAHAGLLNGLFLLPVVVAYYGLKGVDVGGFLLLQGIFRVAVMLLEIPAGYLSDSWTRREQLVLATVIRTAGFTLVWLASGFWSVLCGELTLAVAICLSSGTLEAYLHEALDPAHRERGATHWQGYLSATVTASNVLASLVGAWLFSWHVDAPILATIGAGVLALLVVYQLPDVARSLRRTDTHPLRDMLRVIRWCAIEHPSLKWLLLGPGSIAGFTLVLFWALQPQLTELGASPRTLGGATGGYFITGMVLSLLTGRLTDLLGEARLFAFTLCSLLVGSALFVWRPNIWMVWLGIVLGAGVVHFTNKPLTISLINHHTPDETRATVLSVFSMVSTLVGGLYLISAKVLLAFMAYPQLILLYLALTVALAGKAFWQIIGGSRAAAACE